MSTQPAPRWLSLAEVMSAAPDNQEPIPPFAGWMDGERYTVTAVLERTCVIETLGDWPERYAVRQDRVIVDPDTLGWRLSTGPWRLATDLRDFRTPLRAVSAGRRISRRATRAVAKPDKPHACTLCGVSLPNTFTTDVCLVCRFVCPTCKGAKSAEAERCITCRRALGWFPNGHPPRKDHQRLESQ